MSLTPSRMLALGTVAPVFTLLDTISGKHLSLDELKSEHATLIAFICNHCPYVKHLQAGLVALAADFQPLGVRVIAISSNDAESYPADAPERMTEEAQRAGYSFPYLYDESQAVAQAYQAACTPDFFVFDGALKLVYRGQFDDSRPGSGRPVTGRDMRAALEAVLSGQPVDDRQVPSVGCNIKWKKPA